jgi:uncharacterized protein (TIGR02145 family)
MNMKTAILHYPLIILGFFVILTGSCKKDDDLDNLNGRTSALFNAKLNYGTLTDQDGNIYNTITIGTQEWMAENLRTTVYRDGTPIQNVEGDTEWTELSDGAYCNYGNKENFDTIATYGRIYNWYAVADSRKLAPEGWHIPTDAEWAKLINYLGGENVAGGKMKEAGTVHWLSPNASATNSSGFTGLPNSYRGSIYGIFYQLDGMSYWWSSTEDDEDEAYGVCLDYSTAGALLGYSFKNDGFAIRCVKD